MAARPTYYEILNVSPSAEPAVIEAAYRALMKRYHPDQGAGAAAERSATEINAAYEVLKDRDRRARYDEREFARQQSVAIAQYTPQPQPLQRRQMHLFGWSGWAVALGLGGFIAATGGQVPEAPAPRSEAVRTAAAADTQPVPLQGPASGELSDEEFRLLAAAVEAERRVDERAGPKAAPEPARIASPVELSE